MLALSCGNGKKGKNKEQILRQRVRERGAKLIESYSKKTKTDLTARSWMVWLLN